MKRIDPDHISTIDQKLLTYAEVALKQAYCPYSHFAVGAALATPDEEIFLGANVENAAYGSSICAERAALCGANAKGHRQFSHLAIVAAHLGGFSTPEPVLPCGSCRQMLYEFSSLYRLEMRIVSATLGRGKIVSVNLSDLLPEGFGPEQVGFFGRPGLLTLVWVFFIANSQS